MEPENEINALLLWDGSGFGRVNGAKGLARILAPAEAQVARSRQRRYRQPRPPRVQEMLRLAYRLKARLNGATGLTRDALAREEGIDPSQLTKILHLLNLAPEIQQHILAMPLETARGPITERRLRGIALIGDRKTQARGFARLA